MAIKKRRMAIKNGERKKTIGNKGKPFAENSVNHTSFFFNITHPKLVLDGIFVHKISVHHSLSILPHQC